MNIDKLIFIVTEIANILYPYKDTNHKLTITLFNKVYYLCQNTIKIRNKFLSMNYSITNEDYNNIKNQVNYIAGLALGSNLSSKDYNEIMKYNSLFVIDIL